MYVIHIPSNNKNGVLQFKFLHSSTQNPQRSQHLHTENVPLSICISKTNCVSVGELHLILTQVFPYGTVHGAMRYTCPPGFPFSIPYFNMSQLTIYYKESQTPTEIDSSNSFYGETVRVKSLTSPLYISLSHSFTNIPPKAQKMQTLCFQT